MCLWVLLSSQWYRDEWGLWPELWVHSSAAGVTYTFDGAGERVKKTDSSGGWPTHVSVPHSFAWRRADGSVLAETDTSGNTVNEYVFFNGMRTARRDSSGNVYYYFGNVLGTRRVQTDYKGVKEQECSSLPYGDGETCLPVPTENLFTGKERDSESGNDYFGARYYASTMGRFLSPDWSDSVVPIPSASLADPQSLNLYSYTRNNPLSRTDPDGHCDVDGEHHNAVWCWLHSHGLFGLETAKEKNARIEDERSRILTSRHLDGSRSQAQRLIGCSMRPKLK